MVKRLSRFPGRPFFWGCSNYPKCTYHIGAHPSGKVIGTPADKDTAQARIEAYHAFEGFRNKWKYTKGEAYSFLQNLLTISAEDAHIAKFDKAQCEKLIKKLEELI